MLGDERVRFALGMLLAILIGFLPAHVVAGVRERAAYQRIDALVDQKQKDATAQEDYPSRPLRMVVPFPAGGAVDILARDMGSRYTEA